MKLSTAFSLLSLLATALAVPMPKDPFDVRKPAWRPHRRDQYMDQAAESKDFPKAVAPKKNPWLYLSNDEAASVIKYLHDQPALNLTAVDDAGAWDNTIMVVDVHPPKKADTLSYLDGNSTAPERYALASISFGATEEPYVQEFVVGPLPISDKTTFIPNTAGNTAPDAKIRVYNMDDDYDFLTSIALDMKDIVSDILDADITDEESLHETFSLWGIDPLWHQPNEHGESRVINWVQFWRKPKTVRIDGEDVRFDGGTLLPQGLYIMTDITGRDLSKWSVRGILYADKFYHSIKEFRAAWKKPGFNKPVPNYDGDWYATDKAGEPIPLETIPPPLSVQPAGQRFAVDTEEKYVKWMDFEFYLTFTRDTGLRLYDVKFKGDRVLYELGLQEAIAHYAGNDPVQSGTAYLDTYYGFGPYAFTQVPGFDVPTHAMCLDSKFHAAEISKTHRCGITIFEADQNYVLQRHSNSQYVSATKNIALIVRSVSTVGNYDYTFDYVFYLDGTMETLVRASGYIQSAYYFNNQDYGYHIHDSLSGSMHDHVLTFKADFDILGTENTVLKHSIEPVEVKYKWNNFTRNTMHVRRSEIKSEAEGKQMWGMNGKDQVIIANKDAKNKYGEERGWKIMPSKGAGMHLTITNSSSLLNSAGFGDHAFYVSRHHDSENRASSPWNAYDTARPMIDFDKFFNDESLVQEDLVVWYNLGMHHVPHSGDIPNTVMTTAQSGMMITPHNYLLGDPSRAVTNQIRINYNANETTSVNTFGSTSMNGTINLADIAWDAFSYIGDVSVRKWPYDPLNPFNDTESI